MFGHTTETNWESENEKQEMQFTVHGCDFEYITLGFIYIAILKLDMHTLVAYLSISHHP